MAWQQHTKQPGTEMGWQQHLAVQIVGNSALDSLDFPKLKLLLGNSTLNSLAQKMGWQQQIIHKFNNPGYMFTCKRPYLGGEMRQASR